MKSPMSKYDIDLLERIDRVEVSPSVWFRIQNSIQALNTERFSVKMSWTFGLAAALIIALNMMVWFSQRNEVPADNLAETFGLSSNYNLYE